MTKARPRSPQTPTRPNARAGAALRPPHAPELAGTTRIRILDAAEHLFAEQGYAGVSMPAIAGASGITAGAIYRHFEGKEDLFFEVVRRAVHAVAAPSEREAGGGVELPRMVAAYTTPRFRLLRRLAVEIHYASAKNTKVRRLLRQALDRNVGEIRAGIVQASQAGLLEPADADLLARAVLVFVMGLMHMETLLPRFVGDPKWQAFVEGRVRALLGMRDGSAGAAWASPPASPTPDNH